MASSVLPFLLLTLALPAQAQSLVGGDLTSQAPYGIPVKTFTDATSNPDSQARFPIEGYNTSLPAGSTSGTGTNTTGWALGISVTSDVSLSEASATGNGHGGVLDKSKFTEATTLSIVPPSGMSVDGSSWRLCAIVFTGGLSAGTNARALEQTGSAMAAGCEVVLTSECIKVVQVGSVSGRANGPCQDLTLPDQCEGQIVGGGSSYQLTPSIISANKFFAAGSAPTSQGNSTAVLAAQNQVWPVVITWTHFSSSGQVHDSAGWLSCLKAPNSTTDGASGLGSGAANRVSIVVVLFSALLAVWMLA